MSTETKLIHFRISAAMKRRLDWAMYCEKLDSQQEVMVSALTDWLQVKEAKWGDPVEPKPSKSTASSKPA